MAAPMEVSLPQTMLQKLLDLLKLESLKFCLKIHVHVICHIHYQVKIDYHNQHESAVLIGLFHTTSSVLPSVESYPNYRKMAQRGVQGYLSENGTERSTGVPLLSAAESKVKDADTLCELVMLTIQVLMATAQL